MKYMLNVNLNLFKSLSNASPSAYEIRNQDTNWLGDSLLNYNWSETVIMHKIWLPSSKHLVLSYGKLT